MDGNTWSNNIHQLTSRARNLWAGSRGQWGGGSLMGEILKLGTFQVFTEGRLCLVCHGEGRKLQSATFSHPLLFFMSCLQQKGGTRQYLCWWSISLDLPPQQDVLAALWEEDFILVSWPTSIWLKAFYLNISKAPISAVLKCSIRYGPSLCSISVCSAEQLLSSNRGWSHLYIWSMASCLEQWQSEAGICIPRL